MMTALGKEGVREVGDYQSSSAIELADEEREDSVVVVRAHGISPERRKYLKELDMPFKDATCPACLQGFPFTCFLVLHLKAHSFGFRRS